MCRNFFPLVLIAATVLLVVECADHCDTLPVEVQFYAGAAPSDTDFPGSKEIGELVEGLTKGLATLFQPHPNISLEEMWNISAWNTGISNTTDEASATNSIGTPVLKLDVKPPTNPLGELGKQLHAPDFLKNGLKHGNEHGKPKGALPSLNVGLNALTQHGEPQHVPHETAAPEGETPVAEQPWGIVVPYNTLKVEIAKIDKGKISEVSKLDSSVLSSNKTVKDINKFAQYIDLTDLKLQTNDLFIVCLTMSIVKNEKQSNCQRCLLLRLCDPLDSKCAQKFLSLRAPDSKVHPYSADLEYLVLQLPLDDMKLQSRLTPRPLDARCEGKGDSTKNLTEKTSKLFSNTVLYVEIPNLSPTTTYVIEANLVINWGDKYKAPYGWSNPLVIHDYLDNKQEFFIYACGVQNTGAKVGVV